MGEVGGTVGSVMWEPLGTSPGLSLVFTKTRYRRKVYRKFSLFSVSIVPPSLTGTFVILCIRFERVYRRPSQGGGAGGSRCLREVS